MEITARTDLGLPPLLYPCKNQRLPTPLFLFVPYWKHTVELTPEQKARQKIDEQLDQCGWQVQRASEMNISVGLGVAIREFPLKTGVADYMLYADAKAIGVIEAKPEDHTLTGVETQSAKYTSGLPNGLPHYHLTRESYVKYP